VTQFRGPVGRATGEADDWLNSAMRGYLRHRRADLVEMDRSEVARCFTRKIILPRTVSDGKNYAPVT